MPNGRVTVFIPVLNGRRYLEEVLDSVAAQGLDGGPDILIIDSGSTDGSVDIVRDRKIRLVQIPNPEFQHGRTRNLAMSLTETPFVAFLTQDATPAHDRWLAELLAPFGDPAVGATYGSQIPRPHADARTARIITDVYAAPSLLVRHPSERFPVFSDVNSCLRRTAWESVPFRDVRYAEDYYLARDLLAKGRRLAFNLDASVIHSNDVSLGEHFGRMADEVAAIPVTNHQLSLPRQVRNLAHEVRRDAGFAWRRSRRRALPDVAWAAAAETQRALLMILAARSPRVFARLHERISLERRRKPG